MEEMAASGKATNKPPTSQVELAPVIPTPPNPIRLETRRPTDTILLAFRIPRRHDWPQVRILKQSMQQTASIFITLML